MRDVYFATGLFMASLLIVGFVRADGVGVVCEKPDPYNTKKCKEMPDNSKSLCSDWGDAESCDAGFKYWIDDFPKQAIPALKGAVEEKAVLCYKGYVCHWDEGGCAVKHKIPKNGEGDKHMLVPKIFDSPDMEPVCPKEVEFEPL